MTEYLTATAPHVGMGLVVTFLSALFAFAIGGGNKQEIDTSKPVLAIVAIGLYALGMWQAVLAMCEARLSWLWTILTWLALTVFCTGALLGLQRDRQGRISIKKNSPEHRFVTKFLKVPVDAREWSLCGLSWAIGPMLI